MYRVQLALPSVPQFNSKVHRNTVFKKSECIPTCCIEAEQGKIPEIHVKNDDSLTARFAS